MKDAGPISTILTAGSPNEFLPHSDVFYTINVLLGMSRVPQIPQAIDGREIFHRNVRKLFLLPVKDYALGMALWAGAELDCGDSRRCSPTGLAFFEQAPSGEFSCAGRWNAVDRSRSSGSARSRPMVSIVR